MMFAGALFGLGTAAEAAPSEKRPRTLRGAVVSLRASPYGERMATLRRVGNAQLVMSYFHVPAGTHPDFPAIDVLTRILGDPASGRLQKALVETTSATRIVCRLLLQPCCASCTVLHLLLSMQ